jgi:hypothetical protein
MQIERFIDRDLFSGGALRPYGIARSGSGTSRNAQTRRNTEVEAERRNPMRHLNPSKAAISVGTVVGAWHLVWVTLVAIGVAKAVMDFVLKLHFIQLDYTLAPFALSTAAMLVGLTFAIGALFGLLFALVWNWLSVRSEAADIEPAFSSR